MGGAAIRIAAAGWPVIPVWGLRGNQCACGNPGCSSRGKHPVGALVHRGATDASGDVEVVKGWWARGQWNIAIATGSRTRTVVIDIDGQEGETTLAALQSQHGPLPETLTARTGGGGRHLIFHDDWAPLPNSSRRLGPGIDTRGEGGYILVCPSLHVSGRRYKWINPRCRPASLPAWVRELLSTPPAKVAAAAPPRQLNDSHAALVRRARIYVAAVEGAGKGRRNNSVFNLAGHLRRFVGEGGDALAETEILELLGEFARRCDPPLDPREVAAAAKSSAKNGTPREAKPDRPRGFRLRGREVVYGQ